MSPTHCSLYPLMRCERKMLSIFTSVSQEKTTQPTGQIVPFKNKAGCFHPRDIPVRKLSADPLQKSWTEAHCPSVQAAPSTLPSGTSQAGPHLTCQSSSSCLDWGHTAQNMVGTWQVLGSWFLAPCRYGPDSNGFLPVQSAQNSKLGLLAHDCTPCTHKTEAKRS